jgi:hypothetical protein
VKDQKIKKYMQFIKNKIKKITEFLEKQNKNHLFTEIYNSILLDPYLSISSPSLSPTPTLLSLLRFSQKLIIWFRAFHKQEDVFKKPQLKYTFFKKNL